MSVFQQLARRYKGKTWPEKILKFMGSLELAVLIIISISVIAAIGTFVEARYGATYAQKKVYHSPYMYFVLGLLVINLIQAMVDRWPWKKRHTGFVLAHIGILILLFGAWLTRYYGIDGSLALDIGQTGSHVTLNDTEVSFYSQDVQNNEYHLLLRKPVDFLVYPPGPFKYEFQVQDLFLRVVDFAPFALPEFRVQRTTHAADGPALRVQLESSRFNFSRWLVLKSPTEIKKLNLGPATLVFHNKQYQWKGGNVLVFQPISDSHQIKYEIYSRRKGGLVKKGVALPGDEVLTGWMDMKLRFLNFYPHAKEEAEYKILERPTPLTTSALKYQFKDEEHWLGVNSSATLFTNKKSYLFAYHNQRLPLGFKIKLLRFQMDRYQGTQMAASYASDVLVDGRWKVRISMNNPLKYKGYTFYQASFTSDESGRPTSSIFSVNKDPGRPIKNLGSFLIVLGIIMLFYFKKYYKTGRKDA
ncbi:MAG: cytochrome c biogenesis protein [Bdellovibrio sp.]|nr:MAG: cytochrome c biogenesis protein [Bdellovibrio sp.]